MSTSSPNTPEGPTTTPTDPTTQAGAVLPGDSSLAPAYDRSAVTTGIVHLGLGNFHRAHQAMYLDRLMRQGKALDWGICGVGVMPSDARMRDVMDRQDGFYTLVLKHPDGHHEPTVIGSVHDYLFAPDDPAAVLDVMTAPTTRIVSLTVTEGGYNIDDATGSFRTDAPGAQHDATHPEAPTTAFGFIVEALRRRRAAGTVPFTVMSCDNLPGNGTIARTAVVAQARLTDAALADWIESSVESPNCMVDRITPATTPADVDEVRDTLGIEDAWPVTCEPFTQWVLEDRFTAGRPPFEEVGVQLVEDVVPYELMKLRLLNASHQALAHWGRLLGMTYGHEAAADPLIAAWTRAYLEREARPTLLPVPGIDLDAYVDTLFERFTNAAIADTLSRLAFFGPSGMPKFVLPTIRDNLAAGRSARLGTALCAAWALGAEGTDEAGQPIPDAGDHLADYGRRQREGEVDAFLTHEEVFGDLAADERFRTAFLTELAALKEQGARARMETLLG